MLKWAARTARVRVGKLPRFMRCERGVFLEVLTRVRDRHAVSGFCHEGLLMSRGFLTGTFLSLSDERPLDQLVPSIKFVQTLVQELQVDNWKRVPVNRGSCQQYMNKDHASTILATESRSFPG
jgi:hypothetical protein